MENNEGRHFSRYPKHPHPGHPQYPNSYNFIHDSDIDDDDNTTTNNNSNISLKYLLLLLLLHHHHHHHLLLMIALYCFWKTNASTEGCMDVLYLGSGLWLVGAGRK
jgi:hypothetical protein